MEKAVTRISLFRYGDIRYSISLGRSEIEICDEDKGYVFSFACDDWADIKGAIEQLLGEGV